MADEKKKRTVRIELTEEQRAQLKIETGKDLTVLEYDAEELEERIAPVVV
jgi:hypothetical protein